MSADHCSATDRDVRDAVDDRDDVEAWAAVGREAVHEQLFWTFDELEAQQHRLESKIVDGEPVTADDLAAWRQAFHELERKVEGRVAPTVDGADPFEQSHTNLTYGRLRALVGEEGDDGGDR